MSKLADLTHALASWAPGDTPCATWLLPELRTLLRAQFAGAYRPSATDVGWSLDFMHGDGAGAAEYVQVFRGYVDRLPASEEFLAFSNPHLVQDEQRNQVMLLPELARLRAMDRDQPVAELFRALGIAGHDQIRMLVCDGPRQLAWVGATREEHFTKREATLLRRLCRPLRERLRLERHLSHPGVMAAALDAALEALPTAAFIVGPHHEIELANRAGLALLASDRKAIVASIRQSALPATERAEFSISRLGRQGEPAYLLAIRKDSSGLIELVATAQKRWRLTTRQARVLELVAAGISNKEIATSLACSEATVENHLTELFRRSGARSRAGLVGRLIV